MASTFLFADGGSGHLCDMGSAPAVGETDVLCINSDTIVTSVTSSGGAAWSLAESAVSDQAAYIYIRKATGGEPATVTVTTSGNFNTHVGWSRWPGLSALDTSTNTQASSAAAITPVHSTGVMAESTELVVAFGALHSIGTANQNTPVWSAGFGEVTSSAAQGTSTSGVRGYVGYKQNAGTAAEAPRVQWSGDSVTDRYMLTVSFTTTAAVSALASLAAGTGVAHVASTLVSTSIGVASGVGTAPNAHIVTSTGAEPVRYRFSSFGRKWRFYMFTDRIDSSFTQRVQVGVEADSAGLPYDPTDATVQFAFLTSFLDKPDPGDWKSGSWDVTRIGSYVAQCNVGAAGVIELQPGNYYVWMKITDPVAGETPGDQLAKLIVT